MTRLFLFLTLYYIAITPAYALYTTKDEQLDDCVPVETTASSDVQYRPQPDNPYNPTIAQAGVQAQDGGNVAMNLRIPPSRINNRAFQEQLSATEVHVGTYYKEGKQEDLSVLGENIPTGSTRYCQ